MINGHKIVVVTPAGRRRYLEVLARYVLSCGAVDGWRLWQNTTDAGDIAWMDALAARDPRVVVEKPAWACEGNFSIYRFFPRCTDPATVYIRLDDDVVWADAEAIPALAAARLENPHPFLLYGNVVNTGITSHLHQRAGRLSKARGLAGYACTDPVGWGSGEFALDLHRGFLANPHAPGWWLPDWDLYFYERHSINCISWLGSDAARWAGVMDRDEEQWLSVARPKADKRPNNIIGRCVFVHYAFHTQRERVDAEPAVLAGYRRLAGLV